MRKRIAQAIALGFPILLLVAGCAGQTAGSAASVSLNYTSPNLDTSYPDALPAATQLALGTLLLEGTDQAVSPEQARTLLPLWQALQGRRIQDPAEMQAVFRAIEQAMTPEQLRAIAGRRLTTEDLAQWMAEHRPALPQMTPGAGGPYPELRATLRVGQGWGNSGPWPQATPGARRTPGAAGRESGSFYLLLSSVVQLLSQRAGS